MPVGHKRNIQRSTCIVDGCNKKGPSGLWLSITGDPFSDRVCKQRFAQTEAFLSRGPCIGCGLKREDHQVAAYWTLERCLLCHRDHRRNDPEWLNRPPCEVCGVTREKDNAICSWDKICNACLVYRRKNGVDRPKDLEIHRQAIEDARNTDTVECHICGISTHDRRGGETRGPSGTERVISSVDHLARCKLCHEYKKRANIERPFLRWDGAEAFGTHYSTMFRQWRTQ
jgi:hypothetical protein